MLSAPLLSMSNVALAPPCSTSLSPPIGLGLSNKEIGRRLEISDQTVKMHLHRVYATLHRSGRFKASLAQPHERAPAPVS